MAVVNPYLRTFVDFQVGVDGVVGTLVELDVTFPGYGEAAQSHVAV